MHVVSLLPVDVGFDPRVTGAKVNIPYGMTLTVKYLDADGRPSERTADCDTLRAELRKAGYEVEP